MKEGGIIIQIALTVLVILAPYCAGFVFLKKEEKITLGCLMNGYVLGQMSLWAMFQMIAVPFVLLKGSFSVLFWIFIVCAGALSLYGIWIAAHHSVSLCVPYPDSIMMWMACFVAAALIILQLEYYIFGVHLDSDDARWIAEAGDAITKNTLFLHNPATGEYLGLFQGEMLKEVYSPFPLYIAVLSKMTMMKPAVMAHSVFAPLMLVLSYMSFARLAQLLFNGFSERVIFVLGVAAITLFFHGGSSTAAAFTLIRIWQGKAVVAGVMIPVILSQIVLIQKQNLVRNWLILGLMGCAGSMLSGMGILLSLIMIGGYGIYIIFCNRLKGVFLWLVAMTPAAVFEVASQIIQKVD